MIVYTGMIFWFILIYCIGRPQLSLKIEPGEIPPTVSVFKAIIMMAYPIFFIGLRSAGSDTYAYISGFKSLPTGFDAFWMAFKDFRGDEKLFEAFGIFVKTYISSDFHVYLFLIAFISGLALVLTYRKYSAYFLTSMLLFALSSNWVWMINGIRQFIAVTLAMAAVGLIVKRRPVWYIIIIFILSGIHASAIVLLPVYFIVTGDAWNKRTLITIGLAVLALIFTAKFTDILGTVTEGTSYEGVTKGEMWNQYDGANPVRFFIYAVVPVLAFIKRREVQERGNDFINICVNMSVICACISAISVVTSGIMMGRVPIYFSVYNYILLPWLIANTWDDKRNILFYLMLLMYLLLYIYSNYILEGVYYLSDILNIDIK